MRISVGQVARCCLGGVLALALVVAANGGQPAAGARPTSTVHPLVGAYYYLWNPQNFAGGTLRAHLVPPQVPAGSLVNSQSPRTAARDITNARRAGIDFFAMDWWPYDTSSSPRSSEQERAMQAFLAAPNISRVRFAMFYETWNLGFDPGRESTPVTFQMELNFDTEMVAFAKQFFHNRSYLRINGRPVVFLYLTRTLTGDVAGMIRGARTVLQRTRLQPVLHRRRGLLARHSGEPEPRGADPHAHPASRPHRAVRRGDLLHPVLRRSRSAAGPDH